MENKNQKMHMYLNPVYVLVMLALTSMLFGNLLLPMLTDAKVPWHIKLGFALICAIGILNVAQNIHCTSGYFEQRIFSFRIRRVSFASIKSIQQVTLGFGDAIAFRVDNDPLLLKSICYNTAPWSGAYTFFRLATYRVVKTNPNVEVTPEAYVMLKLDPDEIVRLKNEAKA